MSRAKIHHYVPQFLLRPFAVGKSGSLYVYDKSTDETYQTGIDRAAAESGFYDVDLPSGVTAEEALGVLEGMVAPLTKRIIGEAALGFLSSADRETLAVFVAVQHLRTTAFREMLLDSDAKLAAMFEELGAEVPGFEPLPRSGVREHTVALLGLAGDLAPMLLAKRWILIRNDTSEPFYTSDSPVAMENPTGAGIGMGVPGIRVSLPLSGSLMLCMLCASYETQARAAVGYGRMLIGVVARPLLRIMSRRFRRAFALVDAIESDSPLRATSEEVRSLNALRVVFAERRVYAGSECFAPARELVRADLSLRTGPRLQTS